MRLKQERDSAVDGTARLNYDAWRNHEWVRYRMREIAVSVPMSMEQIIENLLLSARIDGTKQGAKYEMTLHEVNPEGEES